MTKDDDFEPDHKAMAVATFNATWDLMDKQMRTAEENDMMVHSAHASRYHWGQVGGPTEFERGDWQISRVYALLGKGTEALHYAKHCLTTCQENEDKKHADENSRSRSHVTDTCHSLFLLRQTDMRGLAQIIHLGKLLASLLPVVLPLPSLTQSLHDLAIPGGLEVTPLGLFPFGLAVDQRSTGFAVLLSETPTIDLAHLK